MKKLFSRVEGQGNGSVRERGIQGRQTILTSLLSNYSNE